MLNKPSDAICYKTLVVGDFILRRGIASAVHEVLPSASIVEAPSFSDATARLESAVFFAAIFDIDTRDSKRALNFRTLRDDYPDLVLSVLSHIDSAAVILRYLSEGVNCYILKWANQSESRRAISAVFSITLYVPPSVVADPGPSSQDLAALSGCRPSIGITERQLAVLRLVRQGYSNKEIGRKLSISPNTVKIHVSALLRYFSVARRKDLTIAVPQTSEERDSCYNPFPRFDNLAILHDNRTI